MVTREARNDMSQKILEAKYDLCPLCETVWVTKHIQSDRVSDEVDEDVADEFAARTPPVVHHDALNRVWCMPCWQGPYGEAARRVEKDVQRVNKLLRLAACESATEHERHLAYLRAKETHARTQEVETKLRTYAFKRKFAIVMGLCILAMPCFLLAPRCHLAAPFWCLLGCSLLAVAVWHGAWKKYRLPIGMLYRHIAFAVWLAIVLGVGGIVEMALCESIQVGGSQNDSARA